MTKEIGYASHLRSTSVLIQLTHSMLPLSLLILGCYTCSTTLGCIVIGGTSIATYDGYMSRDNGSWNRIGNIECTSTSTILLPTTILSSDQ